MSEIGRNEGNEAIHLLRWIHALLAIVVLLLMLVLYVLVVSYVDLYYFVRAASIAE